MEILKFVLEEHPCMTIAFIVIIGSVVERVVKAVREPHNKE